MLSPSVIAKNGLYTKKTGIRRPYITGTLGTVGQVLTVNCPGFTATGWQWRRNGANISGANAATYAQVSADVVPGTLIDCIMTGSAVNSVVASVPLPVPTLAALTLSAFNIAPGAAPGTVISTITGKTAGSTLSVFPADGRVAIAGNDTDGWKLVVGLSAISGDFTASVRETLAGAIGSPRSTPFNLIYGAVQPLLVVQAPGRFPKSQNTAAGANCVSIIRYPFYIGSGDVNEFVPSATNTYATASNSTTGNARVIIEAYLESAVTGVRVPVLASGAAGVTIPWGTKKFLFDSILPAAFGLAKATQGELFWFIVHERVPLTTDKFLSSYSPINTYFAGQQSYVYDPTVVTPPTLAGGSGPFVTTGLTAYSNGLPGLIVLGRHVTAARSFGGVAASFFRDGTGLLSASYRSPLNVFQGIFEETMVNSDQTSWMNGVGVPNDSSDVWACLNMGVFGSGVSGYDSTQDYRDEYYVHCTDIWEQYGGNDSANTAASIQTSLTKLWTRMKVKNPTLRIWRSNFTTRTTSVSGNYTGEDADQTYNTGYGPGATMETVQNWFPSQVGGLLYGILPFSAGVRSRTDYWKFSTNYGENVTGWNGDYLHPTNYQYHSLTREQRKCLSVLTASVPGNITGLTATSSDTTVTIVWTPTGHTEGHLFEWKPSASGTWTSYQTYDYAGAECLPGLTPSTSYDYRITPVNRNGSGTMVTGTISTVATPTLVADGLTISLTSLYSTVRLRGAYLGASMRIRRDSDGQERDIYYTSSRLPDEAFMLAWVGATGYARVKREYDQMTGRKDFQAAYTSGSTVGWPRIMWNGVLTKVKSKATEYYANDNSQSFTTASSQTGAGSLDRNPASRSIVFVIKPDSVNVTHAVLGGSGGYVAQQNSAAKAQASKQGSTSLITSTGSLVAGVASVVSIDCTGATEAVWIDGVASGVAAVTGVAFTAGVALKGASNIGSSVMQGYIPAMAIYDHATLAIPTADRQALEAAFASDWAG